MFQRYVSIPKDPSLHFANPKRRASTLHKPNVVPNRSRVSLRIRARSCSLPCFLSPREEFQTRKSMCQSGDAVDVTRSNLDFETQGSHASVRFRYVSEKIRRSSSLHISAPRFRLSTMEVFEASELQLQWRTCEGSAMPSQEVSHVRCYRPACLKQIRKGDRDRKHQRTINLLSQR